MTIARELLAAAKAGEDRSVELAETLAGVVLDTPAVKLALEVLEGGALTITRAIRLAESIVMGAVCEDGGEASSGTKRSRGAR